MLIFIIGFSVISLLYFFVFKNVSASINYLFIALLGFVFGFDYYFENTKYYDLYFSSSFVILFVLIFTRYFIWKKYRK